MSQYSEDLACRLAAAEAEVARLRNRAAVRRIHMLSLAKERNSLRDAGRALTEWQCRACTRAGIACEQDELLDAPCTLIRALRWLCHE